MHLLVPATDRPTGEGGDHRRPVLGLEALGGCQMGGKASLLLAPSSMVSVNRSEIPDVPKVGGGGFGLVTDKSTTADMGMPNRGRGTLGKAFNIVGRVMKCCIPTGKLRCPP